MSLAEWNVQILILYCVDNYDTWKDWKLEMNLVESAGQKGEM